MILDIVTPVLMPNLYLEAFCTQIESCSGDFNIRLVLDYSKSPENIHGKKFREISNGIYSLGSFGSAGIARNHGLKTCNTGYVVFWDVDDEPQIQNLKSLLSEMESQGADVGIGNWKTIGELRVSGGTDPISVGKSPGLWRFIFRRSFIQGLEFSDLKWGEDQLFIAQVLARKPRVVTSEKATYHYRKNTPGSLTTNYSNVVDLITSTKEIILLANESQGEFGLCLEIMLFRQILTMFKHGGIKLGSKAVLNVFKFHKKKALIRNITKLFYRSSRSWN